MAHRRILGVICDEPGAVATFEAQAGLRSRARASWTPSGRQDDRGGLGEQRGFDGGKKVRGRKRHILVDTEGLVLEARVHSARVPDQDGIRRLLDPARDRLPRLSYLDVGGRSGYRGRGKEWAEKRL